MQAEAVKMVKMIKASSNFLSPSPSKIILVGLNYKKHAKELNMPLPENPILFLKPPSALIFHEEKIIFPEMSNRVDFEAELAVIIGKKCKNISEKDAREYIRGYTCLNDVTARDLQNKDSQWTRAKSFDTFCPVGPVIAKNIGPDSLSIKSILNGKIMQNSNTRDMIFKVGELISFISKIMTLNKGDIIATGTPEGIGPMKKGDMIEIEIEGIGVLRNYVR